MKRFSLQRKAQRVTNFLLVQFCALLGWIVVQLIVTLSPLGHLFSFSTIMIIESIWWIALLLLMLRLFLAEYNRFVQAALELEKTHLTLRQGTNTILGHLRKAYFPDEQAAITSQQSFAQNRSAITGQQSLAQNDE